MSGASRRFLGLGPANVKREPLAQSAPRALSEDEQRALLRAAEASRPRDRAIVTLLLYTMPRLHELAALNVDDVSMSARKGLLVIRSGKGDPYREVPLNPSCRKALAVRPCQNSCNGTFPLKVDADLAPSAEAPPAQGERSSLLAPTILSPQRRPAQRPGTLF